MSYTIGTLTKAIEIAQHRNSLNDEITFRENYLFYFINVGVKLFNWASCQN